MSIIGNLVNELADNGDEIYSIYATVIKIDKGNGTIDVEPLNGTANLTNVKLIAEDGKCVVYYPMLGSTVILNFIDKNTAYVAMYSSLELITIATETESLKDILSDLIDAINQLTVITPSGASSVPVNIAQFTAIKLRLDLLFDK